MARTPNRRCPATPGQCWCWLLAVLLVPVLIACGAQQSGGAAGTAPPASDPAARPIKAVTTMSILSDMIKNVGRERVEVHNIIPVGAGPEEPIKIGKRLPILVAVAVLLAGVR